MGELVMSLRSPKRVALDEALWGTEAYKQRGELCFGWAVHDELVSRRYRALRSAVITDVNGLVARLPVDGIGAVFTLPIYRCHGYATALLSESLKMSRLMGDALGMLFCRSTLAAWYRDLGWSVYPFHRVPITFSACPVTVSPTICVGLFPLAGDVPAVERIGHIAIAGTPW